MQCKVFGEPKPQGGGWFLNMKGDTSGRFLQIHLGEGQIWDTQRKTGLREEKIGPGRGWIRQVLPRSG